MHEDPIWCFLNMRCEMEEDDSGLRSMDTSNKVGNKKSQSSKSFQSKIESEQQRRKQMLQQKPTTKILFFFLT